jgi:dynein heavy chain
MIIELKKPSIRSRHWEEIVRITGKKLNYEQPDQLTIEELYGANLLAHEEDILDVTDSADK